MKLRLRRVLDDRRLFPEGGWMRVVARVKRERAGLHEGGGGGGKERRLAPSRDVFVARRRREWRWARKPNYELFSPRHGAPAVPLYRRCTHLPGAFPPPFVPARDGEGAMGGSWEPGRAGRRGWREREDVSAGFPPPLMGMWYELFVGCSLAFSHCYATVLLARHPPCTTTKGINVSAHCRAAYAPRRERGEREIMIGSTYIISANARSKSKSCYAATSQKFWIVL